MSKEFIQKMFPEGRVDGRGGEEVNGLPAGSQPQNVTIIKRWNRSDRSGRREFFHVTDGEHVAVLRVCKAGDYVDYDEFAVIHGVALVGSDEATELTATANRWSE